ncbi:T9SS sorting signal type C domain-containing protein [Winogradskyella algicola]|uniref:T9SS sorting signal type C domain-containing protein n=1 Tax=Winogradskyella algicola TaxID=2575815 RepID=UPI001108C37F|nr:T9SS sorting signal type C domain-containing protein [Winogradskyella algicola]
MKKFLLAPIFIFLCFTTSVIAQCPSFGTDQCTTAAPNVVGNSIICTPALNDGGRRNFRVTNMIANATYRVSNCGSGVDTQMTIRTAAGAFMDYNDDGGPACTGTAASIDFIPPATGDYRIQLNRYNCQTSGFLDNGDITVTLIADPPPPVTNDECSGATALTVNADLNCGVTTAGTTLGATASPQADDVTGTPNNDVWYSFIATDTAHVVSLLNVVLVNGSTDMGIGVYDGTLGCSALTFVDDSDPNTLNLTGLTIGNLYYVRVYGWFSDSSDAANFDVCVGTDSPCVLPAPITAAACPAVDVTPDSATVGSCGSGSGPVDLTAAYTDLGDTSDYDVDLITWDQTVFDTFAAAATNNVALSSDDRWSNLAYNIPFDFCFYGNSVSQFVVGANGAISFDSSLANTGSGFSFSDNLPSTTGALFENTIYGVYHDIDPSVGGTISFGTTNANGCNALVILWDDIPMWDNGNFGSNTKRHTAMMVLYENTNIVEVHIEEKVIDDGPWNGGNAIVGIQNPGATAAVVAPCRNGLDTNWATTNEVWRFTPSGGSSIATLQWLVDGTLDSTYNGQTTISVNPTSTTTYTAQVTYNLCNASTLVITDDVIVSTGSAKIWDGSQPNDNWMDPLNWSDDAIPTPADCVIIPNTGNDPVIYTGSDGDGLNLTIENGATLTQQPNSTLTIVNFIDVETGGTYNMDDSSSLVQVDDVANTVDGTFTMNRNTNIRVNDYVYWSSPVISFNIENISPGTPNGYKYEWIPTLFQGIGPPGNMVFGEWQGYNTGVMDIGKGYIVKGPTGHTATPSNYTATFSGTPNNGTIVQPIERGTYTGINYFYNPYGNDLLLVTSDDDNWNLVGNPYPSAINAIDFLTHTNNGNISGSVYLWTHGTDIGAGNTDPFYDDYVYNYNVADYVAYNSSGASTPLGFNGNIGAGQGFFVLMTDTATTNETVTFDNTMRSSAYANNQFYRTSNPSNMDSSAANRIWLDYVNPSGQTSTTLVAYVDGATNDEDRMYDAHTTTGNGLDLYSLIDEKEFLIQGRQLPFDANDQVPLGLNIAESGIHTIAINTLQGLFNDSNQDIFIEDLLNDTIHNIKESPYSFTSEIGIINDRFVLRFTNSTLGLEDFDTLSGVIVFEDNEKITVKSDYGTIASIDVYDVLGRTLYSNKTVNVNRFSIEPILPKNATLLLKIKLTDGKQKVAKIIF